MAPLKVEFKICPFHCTFQLPFLLQTLCFLIASEEDSDNPLECKLKRLQQWDSNPRPPAPQSNALTTRPLWPPKWLLCYISFPSKFNCDRKTLKQWWNSTDGKVAHYKVGGPRFKSREVIFSTNNWNFVLCRLDSVFHVQVQLMPCCSGAKSQIVIRTA